MIEIIRPIPGHLDAADVARHAAMTPELVRAYMHGYQMDRRDRTDRYDRDRYDGLIEVCRFVLSECDPPEVRIARERAEMARIEVHLRQHRELVARLEQELREHAMAADELCLMAQQQEVAA